MIGIIDIGIGNIPSIVSALKKKSIEFKICKSKNDFNNVKKIILPGVGSFKTFSQNLYNNSLYEVLKNQIQAGMPILGICLGFHALFDLSYEFGKHQGLGLIQGEVKSLKTLKINLRVPHVGWNECFVKKKSLLFKGINNNKNFYFTHSFSPIKVKDAYILGTTWYGNELITAVEKDNIYGVQFHPEKSQLNGLLLIENFSKIS